MSRTRNAAFAVAILSLIQSGGAIAQKTETIVGTWSLRSIQIDRDGKKVDLYGPHAAGMAIFDNGGHFISVVINPDVPKFASNARQSGTAEENKAAVLGSNAFFGTYRFDPSTRALNIHIVGSSFPNFTNVDANDSVSFDGDRMTQTLRAGSTGFPTIITYQRTSGQ
jgi:hypothetical protein